MRIELSSSHSPYWLDDLGWLQFEQLCSTVLELDCGLRELTWRGRADALRTATVAESLVAAGRGVRWPAPITVAVMWVRHRSSLSARLAELVERVAWLAEQHGLGGEARILVLTNLEAEQAQKAVGSLELAGGTPRVLVLGADELGDSIDRHPELRARLPFVLGLRDLAPLIDAEARARSSFDLAGAQALARVFSPTRAFERARLVLGRHRFVVLTGPPEMGKTAIARMIGLALRTDGWEAHECTSPEQVWRAFDRDRRQVFVADDAFGSTEYRPDAAERWARELARLLEVLDERHWLIWTSRPAPLKAGLRRVQRERGSERFPSPGEVLVDAGDLELAEKTLILFRHAKAHHPRARRAARAAPRLVCSAGISIVEHPHFTPERIRRFVSERLDAPAGSAEVDEIALLELVERALATPTEAMRASFAALEQEHRDVLIALLDAPAGLIDERGLAATVRRHHPGGLSRAPAELIDRLTDHFLRTTALGIGWVHPSWRDLVIDELRAHADERRRFLSACGMHGAMLVLSRAGGGDGKRALPLLVTDADWDLFTDRVRILLRELEHQDLARLLGALAEPLSTLISGRQRVEARSLAGHALEQTRRAWDEQREPLPLLVLEAWHSLNARLPVPVTAPQAGATWVELHPAPGPFQSSELARADEWLALAQVLSAYDPGALAQLGFPEHVEDALEQLAQAAREAAATADEGARSLGERILARILDLAPDQTAEPPSAGAGGPAPPSTERWWIPEDLDAPPTDEPAGVLPGAFTRADVERVC